MESKEKQIQTNPCGFTKEIKNSKTEENSSWWMRLTLDEYFEAYSYMTDEEWAEIK